MGKASRTKGASFEREIVNAHKREGIDAERVPLSGAAGGSYGHDVIVKSPALGRVKVEAKRRASGFKLLYDALEQSPNTDAVVIRADRKEALYVMPESVWLQCMKG